MHVIGPFADRYEAGRQLAMRLERFAGRNDVVVVGDVTVRNLLALQTISR